MVESVRFEAPIRIFQLRSKIEEGKSENVYLEIAKGVGKSVRNQSRQDEGNTIGSSVPWSEHSDIRKEKKVRFANATTLM